MSLVECWYKSFPQLLLVHNDDDGRHCQSNRCYSMLPADRIIIYFQLVGNATPQVLLAVSTLQDDVKTVCSKQDDVTKKLEEAQD